MMIKQRVIETNEGIQDQSVVLDYDRMMRRLSKKGWTVCKNILSSGIDHGHVLEVGPGPGYLGFEWLEKTSGTRLTGIDISENMVNLARKNAEEYDLSDRAEFVLTNASEIPFENDVFNGVFTNGSLHEWENPVGVFNEIFRVLKPHGRFCVTDLRRDMNMFVKWFMKSVTKPNTMRSGLASSIQAAYIQSEIEGLLKKTDIKTYSVETSPMGLIITGLKL